MPGGEAIDWAAVDRALDWMTTYARCAGCRNGGGPPDCAIRICLEKGYELCSSCVDLEGCGRFEWLGEHGVEVREKLRECRGPLMAYISHLRAAYRFPQWMVKVIWQIGSAEAHEYPTTRTNGRGV